MLTRTDRTFWLLFLGLGLAWGSSYLFVEVALDSLSPYTLVASRLAIGTAVLGAVVIARRAALPRNPRMYLDMAILAAINILLPYLLTTWGQQAIPSGLASVLNSTIPLFTVVLLALFMGDERLSRVGVLGLVVGFGGVVVLTGPSLDRGIDGSLLAEAALLASSLSYATSNVFIRRRFGGADPFVLAFFQIAFSFVGAAVLALAFERPFALAVRPDAVASIVVLGIFASGLSYIGMFYSIEHWGATRTSTIAYALPIWGVTLGWAVLGEIVDWRVLLGTALVVGGIALANGVGLGRRLLGRPAARVAPSEAAGRADG